MKRKPLIFTIMGVLLIITLSNTYKVASTGAPIGSTGAPGENTCGKSGCHTGNNNINTGEGILRLTIPGLSGDYVPGKSYTVTVTLEQENIQRFGFALSVLGQQSVSAGTLVVTDPQRTQVMAGSNQFAGRSYMTYKAVGTNPYSTNKGQWAFEWVAPEKHEGPVTFYMAAVAANNDGTDGGDEVYTGSLVVNGPTGINTLPASVNAEVYPNPVRYSFTVSFQNRESGATTITLYSIKGNQTYALFDGSLPEGEQKLSFQRPVGAPRGVYLLQVQRSATVFTKKIVLD